MGTTHVRWSWMHDSTNSGSTSNTDSHTESGQRKHIQFMRVQIRTVNGTTKVQSWSANQTGQQETHSQ